MKSGAAMNRGFRTTPAEWESVQAVATSLGIPTSELIRRGLALQGVKIVVIRAVMRPSKRK